MIDSQGALWFKNIFWYSELVKEQNIDISSVM